jgi:hypothetical protein
MTGLAVSRYGMNTGTFSTLAAPFALIQLASAVSKLSIPLVGLYALSSIPAIEGKSMPSMGKPTPGMTDWQISSATEHDVIDLFTDLYLNDRPE